MYINGSHCKHVQNQNDKERFTHTYVRHIGTETGVPAGCSPSQAPFFLPPTQKLKPMFVERWLLRIFALFTEGLRRKSR